MAITTIRVVSPRPQVVRLENVTVAGTSSGGSFLEANTARVDPSGDDATGTVGDLTKPFLTVQAAIDAIAVLAAGNDPPDVSVIDVGINSYISEDVTIDYANGDFEWPVIVFKGVTNNGDKDNTPNNSMAFGNLAITGDGFTQLELRLKDCFCGNITTDSKLQLLFDCANMDGNEITSTFAGSNGLKIGSIYGNGGMVGSVTADDTDTLIFGIIADTPGGTIISSANRNVTIASSVQGPAGIADLSVFSVDAPNGSVAANDSLLQDVSCSGFLELVRSKVLGTITRANPTNTFTDDQGPYAYTYDFSRDGGVQGSIQLNQNGSPGNLPVNFVVTGAILEIITPPDSASHSGTISLTSGESAGDLKTAAVVSGAPWSTAGLKALTALLKTTGSRAPAMVIAVQDLTAGKFTLHIEGYLSQ